MNHHEAAYRALTGIHHRLLTELDRVLSFPRVDQAALVADIRHALADARGDELTDALSEEPRLIASLCPAHGSAPPIVGPCEDTPAWQSPSEAAKPDTPKAPTRAEDQHSVSYWAETIDTLEVEIAATRAELRTARARLRAQGRRLADQADNLEVLATANAALRKATT